MIIYYKGAFGINLLWRFRGSAVYRGFVAGVFSVGVLMFMRLVWDQNTGTRENLGHPYAVGVLVGSVSFLITFRANYAYSRYWEACGSVYLMMSKWMDAATHTGVYHLQCDHYKDIRPPVFYKYPELNGQCLTRARERAPMEEQGNDDDLTRRERRKKHKKYLHARAIKKSIEVVSNGFIASAEQPEDSLYDESVATSMSSLLGTNVPMRLRGKTRWDGGWKDLFPKTAAQHEATYFNPKKPWNSDGKGFGSTIGGRTHVLFLQELSHLASLMNAVALSTLRNDLEGSESPLDVYEFGAPWPEADPDLDIETRSGWAEFIKSFVGNDRSAEARTRYNASRPLSVIGGVSDAEIRFIQMARGPSAKTQLCWQWLSEFVVREHLAGSLGAVGPPIVSRVIQFLGDGMIGYNQARKVMYVPFPFPSAQISIFFVLVMIFAVPLLMAQYATDLWLAALLTFCTVSCLGGLHEVARELENPFRNVPNDIPVCTLQAQFNEALVTMYSGYHPDAYWDPNRRKNVEKNLGKEQPSTIPEEEVPVDSTRTHNEEEENKDDDEAEINDGCKQEIQGDEDGRDEETEETNDEIHGVGEEEKEATSEPFVSSIPDSLHLLALIETQGLEIERLRNLVEGISSKSKDD